MSENAIVYRFKGRPFAAETSLELREDELLASQANRQAHVPYRDIVMVRLTFAPRGINLTGYRAKIHIRDGKTIVLEDRNWKSLAETEYPRKEYRAFVLELCARASAANPKVAFQAGRNPAVMALTRLLAAGTTTLGAYLGVKAALDSKLAMAAAFLGFAALFGYWSWQFVMRNAPRTFTAGAVPEAVLPPATE